MGNYYLVLDMRALELRMAFRRYIILNVILLSTISLKGISALIHPAVFPGFHVSRTARGQGHEIASSRRRRARSTPLTMSEMSEDYPSDTGDDRFSSDGESSFFFQFRMPLKAGHRLFYDFVFELGMTTFYAKWKSKSVPILTYRLNPEGVSRCYKLRNLQIYNQILYFSFKIVTSFHQTLQYLHFMGNSRLSQRAARHDMGETIFVFLFERM